MADIFISYSSKDREKAEQLTELLASAGLSVWIDQSGIDVATSWSKEIVQAITNCSAFVILLSPDSIVSENVIKEVSLAAERKKKILPLDLEPVALPDDLAYHLAGLQRTPMTNIDSIIRALGKLGLEATQAPTLKLVKETDGRKSLMILPFEDLSPTADNEWFANGIVSELINALAHVKSLKITDAQTTKEFKSYKGHLTIYAKEMGIHYFVQGDVRKFGEQIKISSRLFDIETGDHLWQDSLKGTMENIFDIQEQVAEKVVEGLKLFLSAEEKKKFSERGTENSEAYELFLQGNEYFLHQTKNNIKLALALYSEAISLDPHYVHAYSAKATSLITFYQTYERNSKLLEDALVLINIVREMKPNYYRINWPLSCLLRLQGKLDEAEQVAHEYIEKAPSDYMSHYSLGYFYVSTGQDAKAIPYFEEVLKTRPNDINLAMNIAFTLNGIDAHQQLRQWAESVIPRLEKYLKLYPDDERNRCNIALLLSFAGRIDEAKKAADNLLQDVRDSAIVYNLACLYLVFADFESALSIFHKSMNMGFQNIQKLRVFLESESSGVGVLKGTTKWEEVKRLIEKLELEQPTDTNV